MTKSLGLVHSYQVRRFRIEPRSNSGQVQLNRMITSGHSYLPSAIHFIAEIIHIIALQYVVD